MANYKTLADRQADRLKALKQKEEQARALANCYVPRNLGAVGA
jgi:hypothetical protein